MIPQESIDAAVKALNETRGLSLPDQARAVLEAASKALMAEAWDEGSQERWAWQWRDDAEPLTNPYRKSDQ